MQELPHFCRRRQLSFAQKSQMKAAVTSASVWNNTPISFFLHIVYGNRSFLIFIIQFRGLLLFGET